MFRERWRRVAEMERTEDQSAPLDVKLRQTAALVELAQYLGDSGSVREEEEQQLRARWKLLRERYHE